MRSLEARQRGHQVRLERMTAQGKCFCGRIMDRHGPRCVKCTYTKKILARQRYTKAGSTYGWAFTVAFIVRSEAFRGW